MARQLAEQLRPELEAAVKRTDSAPGEAYSRTPPRCASAPCVMQQLLFRPLKCSWLSRARYPPPEGSHACWCIDAHGRPRRRRGAR